MKRLFIVFSVVISSFFLTKECNAAEITITYEDYSLVESEAFKSIYNQAKEIAETNNYNYYIILQYPKNLEYYVVFSNNKPTLYRVQESSTNEFYYNISFRYGLYNKYNSSGEYIMSNPCSAICNGSYRVASVEPAPYPSYYYLYSNIDISFTYYYNELIMKFPDITYNLNSESNNEVFPSLYSVYTTYGNIEIPDIHAKEKETLLNFYTICIEKIEYLSTQISNNYIYLSMITIFILIIVIGLLRRYLL